MDSKRAIFIIIFGVLANNYMYLHDAIWNNNPELMNAAVHAWGVTSSQSIIALGQLGRIGVVISLLVIGYGLFVIGTNVAREEEERKRRFSKP